MADDGWSEQFFMHDLLQDSGFLGAMTSAIIPAKINTDGYMTSAQLKKMVDAGCSICNHTFNHVVLGTATVAVQQLETRLCYEWLKYLGLGNCPDYLIYPQGSYTDDTIEIAKGKFTIGRTVKEGMMTPYNDKYQLKVINLLPTVTAETVKRYIARATDDGVGVIFLLHKLQDAEPDANTPTTYWITSRLIEVIKYANEIGAPVMNLKQFVTGFLKDSEV